MKVRILTHSGEDLTVIMDSFNAAEYESKLNDNEIHVVKIGDIVFSRIDVKMILPLTNEEL